MRRLLLASAVAVAPVAVTAQSLADRVARINDGTVRLSFTARPGVCGNGRSLINAGHNNYVGDFRDKEWEHECEPGPVRISMTVVDGRVQSVRAYVGGRWRAATEGVTDFGTVPAPAGADLLMRIAATATGKAASDAIFPATLADSAVVWPRMIAVARNPDRPREARRNAIFWLGQAAGNETTSMLDSIATDRNGNRDVREQAIFALSQRPKDEGVPALIRIAKTNGDREMRKKALFWLGQSGDPRAIALFEEILTKPAR